MSGAGVEGLGKCQRGGTIVVEGGHLPLGVSNVGCTPGGGVYYIIREGGVGGLWFG